MASRERLASASSFSSLATSLCIPSFSSSETSRLVVFSDISCKATLYLTSKSFMHLDMSVATSHCSFKRWAMRFSSTPRRFRNPAFIRSWSTSSSSRPEASRAMAAEARVRRRRRRVPPTRVAIATTAAAADKCATGHVPREASDQAPASGPSPQPPAVGRSPRKAEVAEEPGEGPPAGGRAKESAACISMAGCGRTGRRGR
mmetsp:Transcript_16732/g.58399  ORF Transcript_16732/g.58399 Transcript_16732/m.58399 type:complete len:202 (-) Transcript_16732:39-644(-)